ncbi:major facilitator superfamily multidrug-resistance, DHA1 sub-family [Suillus variegatus]|nr:major facilitator superfamily multidrug-resistance, DHA1 sub-family [Suillus variegatus]
MIARQDDEETPLLQRPEQPMTRTPLPWKQFSIILFLEMLDPLSSQTLAPFIPQLVRDIGVTHGDESQVGRYAGIIQSSYYAAHALTIFHWSQLSDHVGRKPVLLIALLAISVSMFSFGLSKTFLDLVVSRVVCGAFDASNGILKIMVMDITDITNLPEAYSYVPIPWMIANTVGPLIGGSLSRPADRFPDIFGQSELLKAYPYLLPCSISALFALVAWLVTYCRLQEQIMPPQAYLTWRFGLVLPVFYATPIELGGLSLDPPRIGALLAARGIIHGISQLLFYARLHDRFGARALHITGVSSGIPTIILFPVINALARAHGIGMAVWLCVTCSAYADDELEHVLPAAAPNRASLGATNGIAQMAASVARIIGPASAASVFSYSIQEGHDAWLIYYFLIAMAFLAVGTALFLPRGLSVWEDHQ